MKRLIIASMLFTASYASAQGQTRSATTEITKSSSLYSLPSPEVNGHSTSVTEALRTRHSVRSFSSTPLTNQQLSNLCWAAFGMTRDNNHRTAPTAMNRQEIRLFVFNATGIYEYMAKDNLLDKLADGDKRSLVAGEEGRRQAFVLDAPVSLVLVIDFDIFGKKDKQAMMMGCVDAGNVSENINLYCQSVGLATVPRATMDTEGIRKLLGLNENQLPIINNPVGIEKK